MSTKLPMTRRARHSESGHSQQGVMLIEVLVAIVIFSIGVIGLLGLQVTSLKNVGEAQYRAEASLLASSLISQMRTSPAATRATDFASPSGTGYVAWKDSVVAMLPGATSTLPSVDTSAYPTVTFTISWRAINDTGTRTFVTTTTLD